MPGRRIPRTLPKISQVVDVLTPGRPAPIKRPRRRKRGDPRDEGLKARIVDAVGDRPLKLFQLAGELFGDVGDPGVDHLERIVLANPATFIFADGPDHVSAVSLPPERDRQEPAAKPRAKAASERVDTRPFAVTKTYASLTDAGPLPPGAERAIFRTNKWVWLEPHVAKLVDLYPDRWSIDEDGTPTVRVSLDSIDELIRLLEGQGFADFLKAVVDRDPPSTSPHAARGAQSDFLK